MTIIVTMSFPAAEGAVWNDISPSLPIRVDRIIPTSDETLVYGWLPPASQLTYGDTVGQDDDGVDDGLTILEKVGDEVFVRLVCIGPEMETYEVIQENGGSVVGGSIQEGQWSVYVTFDRHETISTVYQECRDRNLPVQITAVQSVDNTADISTTLTQAQVEALQLALKAGYYDVPRRINLTEIAERIGVSDTAASQRIRRGLNKVLTAVFDEMERNGVADRSSSQSVGEDSTRSR